MKRALLPAAPKQNRKRYLMQQSSSTEQATTENASEARIEDQTLTNLTDSVAAFEAIVREVSRTSGFPLAIPGCFLHQVYAIIEDRTRVNQELQDARNSGFLRHLHVEGCGTFLVRNADFQGLVDSLIASAAVDPTAIMELDILTKFRNNVLDHWRELSIPQKKLFELMNGGVEDRMIPLMLLRLGFLVYQTHNSGMDVETGFYFSLPNMRTFIDEIKGGRKEFIQMIKSAKPHRELLRSKLFSKGKLKASSMSLDYHIKDVVGARLVIAKDTALEGKNSLFLLLDKLLLT